MMTLSIPNELLFQGNPLLAPIALTPLFFSLLASTLRQAKHYTLLFGISFTVAANYWLANFGDYSIWTLGGVTFAYIIYYSLLSPLLWHASRQEPHIRPIFFAAVWTVFEYTRSIGFLAYPWALLAHSQHNNLPLLQISKILGIWPITFLLAWTSATAAQHIRFPHTRRHTIRNIAAIAALTTLFLIYGIIELTTTPQPAATLRAALIQQNADSWQEGNETNSILTAENLSIQALRETPQPEIIIWNETILTYPYQFKNYYDTHPSRYPLNRYLTDSKTPLLTGIPYREDRQTYYNATMLISDTHKILDYYGKKRLVPFAEYIPYWENHLVRDFFKKTIGIYGTWMPGKKDTIYHIKTRMGKIIKAATPICFEDAFPDINSTFIRKGAQVLINLTNDSWSGQKSAQLQHYVPAKMVAIELGITLVRSTNSGYTSVTDPWGRITADLPMFTSTYLVTDIPIYHPQNTPYSKLGDILPQLLIILIFINLLRQKKTERLTSAI
ncbi:apolipoprotein N-acyltransferase [Spirochaetia bacterium 38H-sp]|uniref:Apolipoprotein N-acyltransferase n=1 Tax=Rarispira pelagica TaxID=3141764 RepID=A0ABU9U8J5_9SPIR